jgi:hypothetical protein
VYLHCRVRKAKTECLRSLSTKLFDLLKGVGLCLLLPVGRTQAEGVREQGAKEGVWV